MTGIFYFDVLQHTHWATLLTSSLRDSCGFGLVYADKPHNIPGNQEEGKFVSAQNSLKNTLNPPMALEAFYGEIVSSFQARAVIQSRPSSSSRYLHCRTASENRKFRRDATGSGSSSSLTTEDSLDDYVREMVLSEQTSASLENITKSYLREDRPPRVCTLRAFRQDGKEGSVIRSLLADNDASSSSSVFFKPLAASVQATAQARNFETISGRFAMVAFAAAVGVEYVTGQSIFKGIEIKEAGEVAAFCAVCVACMACFTVAWGAKNQIGPYMTKGCQDLVEFTVDDILDGLFYEDDQA